MLTSPGPRRAPECSFRPERAGRSHHEHFWYLLEIRFSGRKRYERRDLTSEYGLNVIFVP
jgi:hypothetical protein